MPEHFIYFVTESDIVTNMKKAWRWLVKFFNTPIKNYGIDGREIIDDSPKVSMLTGVTIILLGSVVITLILIIYFSITE